MPPRAIGALSLSSKLRSNSSAIDGLRQSGALRMLFPSGPDLTAMMINTSGGVTSGDQLSISSKAGEGSFLTVTTQAAERAYRADDKAPGRINTSITVEDRATFHWLPQELILFEGAKLQRRLQMDLYGQASLLMVEPIVFGRLAMGETLTNASFSDQIVINRDGMPIYIDGLKLEGDLSKQLASPALGGGAVAVASVVLVRSDAAALLDPVRTRLPSTGAASLLADDILSVRLLASDSFLLRKWLVPVLELLRGAPLPTSWRL